jgi:3-dehydroquinate dehydratase-2
MNIGEHPGATTLRVLMIGGPNLGRLGLREPEIYGSTTWNQLGEMCCREAEKLNLDLDFRQSDHEGEIVGWLHEAEESFQGVILNAAGYTHTSVAIRDAVAALSIPSLELHLTNPDAREAFRRTNMLADVVTAGIRGLGVDGYLLALAGIRTLIRKS